MVSWPWRVAFLVLALGTPWLLLTGLSQLSRWWMARHDPIDSLIRPPRWCKDGEAYMDQPDTRKMERAG